MPSSRPAGTLAISMRCARPCSAPGPSSGNRVLLPDPRLVVPPELDLDSGRQTRPDRLQLGGQALLKSSIAASFWA